MGYVLPSDTDWVTCSWSCHRNRNPPSGEPGTDYGSGYGSPLYASDNGVVSDRKTSNSSATGRYLTIDLDDGRRVRSLHLSEIWVGIGERIARGEQVGRTGASGYGSDWGYGSHVHQTLFPVHWYDFSHTLDFELYVGGSPEPGPEPEPEPVPPEEEDDMPKNSGFSYVRSDGVIIVGLCNTGSGFFTEWWDGGGAYNSAMAAAFDAPTFAAISESHRDVLFQSCADVRANASKPASTVATEPARVPQHGQDGDGLHAAF